MTVARKASSGTLAVDRELPALGQSQHHVRARRAVRAVARYMHLLAVVGVLGETRSFDYVLQRLLTPAPANPRPSQRARQPRPLLHRLAVLAAEPLDLASQLTAEACRSASRRRISSSKRRNRSPSSARRTRTRAVAMATPTRSPIKKPTSTARS